MLEIVFYGLCHSFVMLENSSGTMMYNIGEAFGHSNTGMTSNSYNHILDVTHRSTVDAVGKLVTKRRTSTKISRYKREGGVSYTLGATITIELLVHAPETVNRVYVHSSLDKGVGDVQVKSLCAKYNIPVETNDKAFNILSPKGNCFVIGEFSKTTKPLNGERPHIVLVNPSDAGNLGTILRSTAGFGVTDMAIVRPAVDIYDPKVVRSSMGALFHVDSEYFDEFGQYRERFPNHSLYPFMLTSSAPLGSVQFREPYSLIFGNEATGLPDSFAEIGQSVIIPHSDRIDSLNLAIAASIVLYEVTKKDWGNR